jgi:nucleoside 2-deoxyribosyltransferase
MALQVENNCIYLAGPEVFLKNASDIFDRKKKLCVAYDFEGRSQFDEECCKGVEVERGWARRIRASNENLIRACGIVIANITPFRGVSADVGTVYEIGFAKALGKLVTMYTNDTNHYFERVIHSPFARYDSKEDLYGMTIEDHWLEDNLMFTAGDDLISRVHSFRSHSQYYYTDLYAFEDLLLKLRNMERNGEIVISR